MVLAGLAYLLFGCALIFGWSVLGASLQALAPRAREDAKKKKRPPAWTPQDATRCHDIFSAGRQWSCVKF